MGETIREEKIEIDSRILLLYSKWIVLAINLLAIRALSNLKLDVHRVRFWCQLCCQAFDYFARRFDATDVATMPFCARLKFRDVAYQNSKHWLFFFCVETCKLATKSEFSAKFWCWGWRPARCFELLLRLQWPPSLGGKPITKPLKSEQALKQNYHVGNQMKGILISSFKNNGIGDSPSRSRS